jgi:SAM-dependent methyltransferase
MSTRRRYYFDEVTRCMMCGDATQSHSVLGQRLNKSQGYDPKRRDGITVSVKRCRRCGLIYSSPQPRPFDIQDHYGVPPESYWHSDDFQVVPTHFLNQITTAKELLQFTPGMKALDLGAGVGRDMIAMERAGFEAYGLEPSKPFYHQAITTMKVDPGRLTLGMIEEADYGDNCFDFISFGAVFEHLYDPAVSLERSLRWLKAGGIIHIEVPSARYLMSGLLNFYYRVRGTNYVTNLSPMHQPFHLYEFDLRSFQELGKRLNLAIERHHYEVCAIMHAPKMWHSMLTRWMKWTNTGMQLSVWLRKPGRSGR